MEVAQRYKLLVHCLHCGVYAPIDCYTPKSPCGAKNHLGQISFFIVMRCGFTDFGQMGFNFIPRDLDLRFKVPIAPGVDVPCAASCGPMWRYESRSLWDKI